ncbi:hypothetical protein JCM37172_21490 [Faecalimonas hominis]
MRKSKMQDRFTYLEKISDERLEKIYCDALEILRKMRTDAMLRKVYRDVNFYGLLERITEIQEAKKELKRLHWE